MSDATFIQYGGNDRGIDEGLEEAVLKIAAKITANAKSAAPVDTGELRASIGFKTPNTETASPELSPTPKDTEAYVGSAESYASYQEFGTRKMEAQPYLRPAVEAVKGKPAEEIIKKYTNEEITKTIKKEKKVTKI